VTSDSAGFDQRKKEIHDPRTHLYRHTVGDQLPSAQEQSEPTEFPIHRMRGAAVRRHHGPSVWFMTATWRFI